MLWIKPISKDRIKTLLNKEPMYCLSIESSNILYIQVGINNEFKLAFCFCAFEKVEREINFNEVGKAQHVKWFYFKNYSDVIAVFILRNKKWEHFLIRCALHLSVSWHKSLSLFQRNSYKFSYWRRILLLLYLLYVLWSYINKGLQQRIWIKNLSRKI